MSDMKGACVLLVEDEPIILAVIEAELADAGFEVVGRSKSQML